MDYLYRPLSEIAFDPGKDLVVVPAEGVITRVWVNGRAFDQAPVTVKAGDVLACLFDAENSPRVVVNPPVPAETLSDRVSRWLATLFR